MKRTLITRALAAFVLSFAVCVGANAGGKKDDSTGNNTGLSLMDAIEQTAEKITADLPKGNHRVAIVEFESANDNLSDYIMEELTGAFFDRKIEVADRQNLEYVYKELQLQMSGDVSDESAKLVGKFLAADMVITGQLLDLDGMYRYRTSAISVETAVRASVTRLNVRSDAAARRMMAALANQKTTVKIAKYGVSEDKTPQTAGEFLDRGLMFAQRNEYEKAFAEFNEAIRLNPNLAAAYLWRGISQHNIAWQALKENRKDVLGISIANIEDRAIADITQAIQLEPNNPIGYSRRADAYFFGKGDYNSAIADYTHAIRIAPSPTQTHTVIDYLNRALCYQNKEDYDKAIADFETILRIDLNATVTSLADFSSLLAEAYERRGSTYFRNGNYDRAITDLTQAIRFNPNSADAYGWRGEAYMGKDDFDRAIADFTQLIRLNPNSVRAYGRRGYAYMEKDDFDRAIADFTQAIRLDPNGADLYYYRGGVYSLKGDFDRAIADWETTLRLNPNHSGAKEFLEKARQRRGR